jgi:hypothetical protein
MHFLDAKTGRVILIVGFFVWVIGMMVVVAGCHLTTKQRISQAHQTVRAILVTADDAELVACAPDPMQLSHCTNPLHLITDAQHVKFSDAMVTAYIEDIKVGQAIIAWKPCLPESPVGQCLPTPVPSTIGELRAAVTQIQAVAQAFGPSAQVNNILASIAEALVGVDRIVLALTTRGGY